MTPRTKSKAAPAKSSTKAVKPLKNKGAQVGEKRATKKPAAKEKGVRAPDLIVSSNEMAEILGVTTRRLTQLVTEHDIPSEGRGKFRIASVVTAYANFLKEGATKKTGTESLDRLREEKALEIRLNRERKDRTLISIDEAIGVIDDVTGLYVSSLTGLPAQITGVPRERQRLNDIFDIERQRLADRFTERRKALLEGRADLDPEAED